MCQSLVILVASNPRSLMTVLPTRGFMWLTHVLSPFLRLSLLHHSTAI